MARRSTVERGYDRTHAALRTQWATHVAAGTAHCHAVRCVMPTRHIAAGSAWDLGHTPDRRSWTGPEHARCNRSEGASRGNRARRSDGRPRHTSRGSTARGAPITGAVVSSRDW